MADLSSTSGRAAPGLLLAGLLLFGVGVLVLTVLVNGAAITPVEPSDLYVQNGTATLSHRVSPGLSGEFRLEGEYAFPSAPGTVLVLTCDDYERLREGSSPLNPIVQRRDSVEGKFSVSSFDLGWYFGSSMHPPPFRSICADAAIVFRWAATDAANAAANRPTVDLAMRELPLEMPVANVMIVLCVVGALLVAVGGFLWSRRPAPAHAWGAAGDEDEGTAETLLRLTAETGRWLERTRRYLVLSGALGIFLWYPVLLPLAWQAGAKASGDALLPLLLCLGVLAFLGSLTILWLREFLRLDRELRRWRERLARLQERERRLLDELSQPAPEP